MKQARDVFRLAPAATPVETNQTVAARGSGPQARRAPRPPDARHEWLSVPEVAALLGSSRQAIHVRLNRGRLPYQISDGRRWVRRDLLGLSGGPHEATGDRARPVVASPVRDPQG